MVITDLFILSTGRLSAQLTQPASSFLKETVLSPLAAGLAAGERPMRPDSWPRLHVPDPVGRRAAQMALDDAWLRLAGGDCAGLLMTFNDTEGRSLAQSLAGLSVDVQTYLTMLVFIDGSREPICAKGGFAFTAPGSRVVRLCIEELKRTWRQDPRYATASFIHEMLHTLGLGENPPTTTEITHRVLAACWRHD